jgi:hypothetical protein
MRTFPMSLTPAPRIVPTQTKEHKPQQQREGVNIHPLTTERFSEYIIRSYPRNNSM